MIFKNIFRWKASDIGNRPTTSLKAFNLWNIKIQYFTNSKACILAPLKSRCILQSVSDRWDVVVIVYMCVKFKRTSIKTWRIS